MNKPGQNGIPEQIGKLEKIRNLKSEYLNDKIKKEDFIDRVLKLI